VKEIDIMSRKRIGLLYCCTALTLVVLLAAASCGGDRTTPEEERAVVTIQLTSSAFADGAAIPAKYTCDGDDISPPLKWRGVPEGTKSLALVCDDPDAPIGTFVHWVLYSIPPSVTELSEGVPAMGVIPNGAAQGTNDFKRLGYGGPCPPPGGAHRYFFKLYALDAELDLKPGAMKKDLVKAMEGHVLAEGQLMGTYQR